MKPFTVALAVSVAILTAAPALAWGEAPAEPQPAIERVDPVFFGLLGYQNVGSGLFGLPTSYAKHFRLAGDNQTAFRGLGQENDVADFFFPTYGSRVKLRNTLRPVPKAANYLKQFDQTIGIANGMSFAGTGLWWGGLAATGGGLLLSIANPTGNIGMPVALVGLGAMGTGYVVKEVVAPVVTWTSFSYLQQSIDAYNEAKTAK